MCYKKVRYLIFAKFVINIIRRFNAWGNILVINSYYLCIWISYQIKYLDVIKDI